MQLTIREATIQDIPKMHVVRMAVKENVLNNPLLVTEADYIRYLTTHGKGWVYEAADEIAGFAIVDTDQHNIWALFVHPDSEKKGIGRQLHDAMLNWYFGRHPTKLWLSTAPGTRAAQFYHIAGWKETGITKSGEIKFEMAHADWINNQSSD